MQDNSSEHALRNHFNDLYGLKLNDSEFKEAQRNLYDFLMLLIELHLEQKGKKNVKH